MEATFLKKHATNQSLCPCRIAVEKVYVLGIVGSVLKYSFAHLIHPPTSAIFADGLTCR